MVITSDFETTHLKYDSGNPFSKDNKAVCLGWKQDSEPTSVWFESEFSNVELKSENLYVFFNAKFDLLWYRRLGHELPPFIWCCQLAEFILSRQTQPYPSLNDTAKSYGFSPKLDVVKTEYWDKGIDSDLVPKPILAEYCAHDVDLTYSIYLEQQARFVQHPGLYRLFKLACQDLLILADMEWNGLVFDEDLCKQRLGTIEEKIQAVLASLSTVYPGVPINFNSGDQLSAFLYGGEIKSVVRKPIGVFKSGLKKGQVKYKDFEEITPLPRMVEPLPKTELLKPGVFGTSEGILKRLTGKFAKKYVPLILELSKLDKLRGTYYEGIPKQNKTMEWLPGYIHGQLNQCVAQTGRLSASKPNQQNFATEIQDIFVSRYV